MQAVEQQIRFCQTLDGVRLAYALHGQGPVLVRPSTWLTHLEFDWTSPVWRHWLAELGRHNTVLRYDERGCGLSDRDVDNFSLETWIGDLETVIDAAGADRFDLFGVSQGGPVAIAYAARHPERVRRMILYGSYARGRLWRSEAERQEAELLVSLVRVGWGVGTPAFRRAFAHLLVPNGTPEEVEPFLELQRMTSSAETAARIRRARGEINVTEEAQNVAAPTLALHAREDAMVPFEEGRLLASLIPDCRFVPLEGRNHILLADEPAWAALLEEVRAFLGRLGTASPPDAVPLTSRENDVLRLVARGLDNDAIAGALFISVRTVERHLSNVYAKLGVSGKSARAAAAARFAQTSGSGSEPA
jgi:pimeloyl-ACP methyl ester carboxylesterase/DNA-binding CsgD family transcriptional regulator